jgi:hypothetical protein
LHRLDAEDLGVAVGDAKSLSQLCGEVVGFGPGGVAASSRRRLPARKPRASGDQGITPTPWSAHSGSISRSSSR